MRDFSWIHRDGWPGPVRTGFFHGVPFRKPSYDRAAGIDAAGTGRHAANRCRRRRPGIARGRLTRNNRFPINERHTVTIDLYETAILANPEEPQGPVP
jgi:hypothetical protein